MAAGDVNDALSNIPNIVLVDQSAATAAPGAGYGRLEVVNGVLGVRVGTGAWVPLASLVAGLLTALTEKVTPADTDLILLQDEADSSALKKVQIVNLPGGGPGGGLYDAYVNVQDQKAQNTPGGTTTSGSWQTRVLNTKQADTSSIATLASNQLTLPAGTYTCRIRVPGHRCSLHQSQLYDTTGAAVLLWGSPEYAPSSVNAVSHASWIAGSFTLAVESVLEVRHQTFDTYNDSGFGVAANFGTEVYTVAEFWRVAA